MIERPVAESSCPVGSPEQHVGRLARARAIATRLLARPTTLRSMAPPIAQADELQQHPDPLVARRRRARTRRSGTSTFSAADRSTASECREDEADLGRRTDQRVGVHLAERPAIDADLAARRSVEAAQQRQQRRLPEPTGAERDELAALDRRSTSRNAWTTSRRHEIAAEPVVTTIEGRESVIAAGRPDVMWSSSSPAYRSPAECSRSHAATGAADPVEQAYASRRGAIFLARPMAETSLLTRPSRIATVRRTWPLTSGSWVATTMSRPSRG